MRKSLNTILGGFLVCLMIVMLVAVVWQVLSRYIFNAPSSFTEELARYLLMWIGILGAAYASGQQQHLAINLLEEKLSRAGKRQLKVFINVLVILFCLSVMVVGGTYLVWINLELEQYSAALHIPLYVVYSVLPLSGLFIIYYKIDDIINRKKFPVYGH